MQRVNAVNPAEIAVTIISAEEQLRGRLDIIRRASSHDSLVTAYAKLQNTLEDFRSINVLQFTQTACTCYGDLLNQKIRIGTRDLRIAAITLSMNGILVTHNRKDFVKVPNLQLED